MRKGSISKVKWTFPSFMSFLWMASSSVPNAARSVELGHFLNTSDTQVINGTTRFGHELSEFGLGTVAAGAAHRT